MGVAFEPLPAEKFLVVCVVEALDHGVAPGFRNRDEHRLHAKVQAQPDDQTRGAWIAIAAAKTQFVIKEQIIRRPCSFPAAQQTAGDLLVRFGALGFDMNPVAKEIDDVKRIESAIALDVTRTDEIGLMNVVNVEGFPEIGILDPFRGVSSFF